MAKHDKSPWALSDLRSYPEDQRRRIELLRQLHLAIRDRLDPPPIEEAHWWDKGILVTDHPDGTSTTVPCWTSKVEYQAWHRARFPGSFPVS
jgi:hypothetical protein